MHFHSEAQWRSG